MILTANNYFSPEADMNFMSASQFTSFLRCEAKALAQFNGDYPRDVTTAMLVGSYLDAMVEGTEDAFIDAYGDVIYQKNGKLYADFARVQGLYDRMMRDDLFRSYLEGDKQTILTGTIGGVPFKGKVDIFHHARTVDLKTTANFKPSWDDTQKAYVTFGEYWRYDIQGAIYQELRRQKTSETVPHYLAVITKETEPDLAILSIPDDTLQFALAEIEAFAPDFQAIKLGFKAPTRCGKCDYCKRTKKLTQVIDYREIN